MKILILDIDYTLNMHDPRPIVQMAQQKSWHPYSKRVWNLFRGPAEDMSILPHPIPYKHYDEFIQGYDKVIIITSRLEDWKKPTKKWLKKWGFTYDHLYMRPSGTYKIPSHEIKEAILAQINDKYPAATFVAIDDDKGVVELYKDFKIKVFIAPGEWEKALTYHRRMNSRKETISAKIKRVK